MWAFMHVDVGAPSRPSLPFDSNSFKLDMGFLPNPTPPRVS